MDLTGFGKALPSEWCIRCTIFRDLGVTVGEDGTLRAPFSWKTERDHRKMVHPVSHFGHSCGGLLLEWCTRCTISMGVSIAEAENGAPHAPF